MLESKTFNFRLIGTVSLDGFLCEDTCYLHFVRTYTYTSLDKTNVDVTEIIARKGYII